MLDFVAKISEEYRRCAVNDDLYSRKFEMKLTDHVIDIIKTLQVIPGLRIVNVEVRPFAPEVKFDKTNSKNKDIQKNKRLERIVSIHETHQDLIRVTFEKDINGVVEYETREVFCPRQDNKHFFMLNGKKTLITNQIVDNSTYRSKGKKGEEKLNLRTPVFSFPVSIIPLNMILETTEGEKIAGRRFRMELYRKQTNIIYYYLAKFGLEETLKLFMLDGLVSVVPVVIDPENYYYFKCGNHNIYVEVLKKAAKSEQFVMDFVTTLYCALFPKVENAELKRAKIKDKDKIPSGPTVLYQVYDKRFWMETFSESFSKRRELKNAKSGLISFERIIGSTSIKKMTSIKIQYRKNAYTVMAYLITNYDVLMMKDPFDLKNKRIRNTEVIASVFDDTLRENMNNILNNADFSRERIDKLLNTITQGAVYRAMNSEDSRSILRYERYNDNTAIDLSRYTIKGRGSINGGKNSTALEHRVVYPSQMGKFDIFICSATDPGLTGYLCANPKIYEMGRFSKKKDPDGYTDRMDELRAKLLPTITKEEERREQIDYRKRFNKDGKYIITFKPEKDPNLLKYRKFRGSMQKDGTYLIQANPTLNFEGVPIIDYTVKGRRLLSQKKAPHVKTHQYLVGGILCMDNLLTDKGKKYVEEFTRESNK